MHTRTVLLTTAICLFGSALSSDTVEAAPRLTPLKAFLTDTGVAKKTRARTTTVRPGEKVHFYFRVGKPRYTRAKGSPFKVHVVLSRSGEQVKDYGWIKGQAAAPSPKHGDQYLNWYQDSRINLSFGASFKPGRTA